MRRTVLLAASLAAVAGCGGRTPSPSTTAPSTRPQAAPRSADPASLRYAAGSGRYRIETVDHRATEVMGQSQEFDITIALIVSVAMTADGANLSAAFTIDSATSTTTAPIPIDVGVVRGKTYRVAYSTQGRSISLVVPDTTNPMVVQMGEMFRDFLPILPPGAITAGTSWTDTTTQSSSPAPGMSVRSRAVRDHRVAGWETRDGARALKVVTSSNYTITGEGEQQGQALQFNGAGASTVDQFISAAGAYLAAASSDSSNLTVSVVSAGMEIPIRQSRRATITRLP